MGGDTDKTEAPAPPPPIFSSTPAGPSFDFRSMLQSPAGGNALAALGTAPAPAAMQTSPAPWTFPPPPLVSEPETPLVGSFVLDPSLTDVSTPDGMVTHVLVRPTLSLDKTEPSRYVAIERPVRAAMRLDVFAIRLEDVYDNALEAFATRPMMSLRTSSPPLIVPGAQYWTSAGAITALGASGDAVFTATPNRDTGAAGAVILLQTDADFVLIDAGMQAPDPGLASAVGDELARQVAAYLGTAPLGEAILSRRPPDGHVTPYVGRLVQILTVRGTLDQYQDGSIGAVLAVQNDYKEWYLAALREKLTYERATWEASQPIAPNNSIREQRWQQHLDSALQSALVTYQPPALAVAEDTAGILQPKDDTPALQPPPIVRDDAGAVDLTAIDWEPADDEQFIVLGGGKLGVFPAKGILWRPATLSSPEPRIPPPPAARSVPELHAAGPYGPAPEAPRAVTPWLYLSAVGKEGQMLVRIKAGYGVLVDAGGLPRVTALDGIAAAQTALGAKISKVLITHPHTDHVRHVVDLIRQYNIPAENLVVSEAWEKIGLIKKLKQTKDKDLVDLGYGEEWKLTEVPKKGDVASLSTTVEGQEIDIYALPKAHEDLKAGIAAREKRGKKSSKVASHKYDSASFLYVIGNESSPSRVAVFGDLRGADILRLKAGLDKIKPDGFKAALKDVRIVQGLGHHLSASAGETAEDVRGLDALIEATLHQNGELTIMVQSTEAFSFKGPATTAGKEGALLNYFVRQGARVVFADKAGESPGAAVVDSNNQVSLQGTTVRLFPDLADPRVIEMRRRLDMLREAQRVVRENHDTGPLELGMEDRTAAEIDAALQPEIDALEKASGDLRTLSNMELLAARGTPDEQQRYADALKAKPSSEAEILAAMTVKGPVEQGLASDVSARLRAAVASRQPLSMTAEFRGMPRSVYEAIDKLVDPAQQKALAEKYRELQDLTSKLNNNEVPDAQRFVIAQQVKDLRAQLQKTLDATGSHPALDAELQRLDSAIAKLDAQTETVADHLGRNVAGDVTHTKYVKVREFAKKGMDAAGRMMGALMVIHSIEEVGATMHGAAQGDVNLPQVALGLTHSVKGVDMGLKMLRGIEVGPKEFGFMAILEIGIAATGNYDTNAERAEAVENAAIRGAANLGCMVIGEEVMEASGFLPPPFDLIGAGVGFAIMFAGDWLLEMLGFKEHQDSPPDSVVDVGKNIDGVLDEYKAILGAQEIADRPESQLATLGVADPELLKIQAGYAIDAHAQEVASKELELTTLFEQAYRDAKSSWYGMQYLDQKAAEFTRLRGLAMQGRDDPMRAELDSRWRAMDKFVTFNANDNTWKMDQWDELSRKFNKIRDMLIEGGENVSREKLASEIAAMDDMLENARYRLDPTRAGNLRVAPVLDDAAGANAKAQYLVHLNFYEEQLAGFSRRLVQLGGASTGLPFDNSVEPREAYERLRSIRQMYETRVGQISAIVPELADPTLWQEPAKLTHALEIAHFEHADEFAQLQLLDATLLAASRQATSSLSEYANESDDALRALVKEEVDATEHAIEHRQQACGLVFENELDAILQRRGADEDKLFATQLDLASTARPPGAATTLPFTELELAALHGGTFESRDAKLTSTEAQLGKLRAKMASMRGQILGMDRVVDRQYLLVKNKGDYRYTPGMKPIVVLLVTHMKLSDVLDRGQADWEVFPINNDAVTVLGTTDSLTLHPDDLELIDLQPLLDAARKSAVP